jgi:hypothetical protein
MSLDPEMKQALEAMEARIIERIYDVETKLLNAFRDWSVPIEIRLHMLPSLDARLGLLEERVSKLERKPSREQ